jgi:hypothetical protein
MELFDVVEMPLYGRFDLLGQHGHPVLVAFAVAYHNVIGGKVDVLHPQTQTLHQAQARTVQQGSHDPWGTGQVLQYRSDLVLGQHHGDVVWLPGAAPLRQSSQLCLTGKL